MGSSAYSKAGVDTVKADQFVGAISKLVKSTQSKKILRIPSGYAGLFKLNENQFLAATTDGVGTKLKIAFELNRHGTVGIDLVAMSVNDLICVGATPLFFLDYLATGKLDVKTSKRVLSGIVEGCQKSGVALIGGETAEMPGMYQKGEYDLAGFAVGVVVKKDLITGKSVRPGDALIGVESSGPHSNGYSLIRKIFPKKEKAWLKTCLTPTRIYVREVLNLKQKLGKNLKGMAHITGGGFLNIPRINENFDYEVNLPKSFKIPNVFLEMKKRAKLSWQDLYTTFNMGFGMIFVVPKSQIEKTKRVLRSSGLKSHHIGYVRRAKSKSNTNISVSSSSFSFRLKY